MARTLSLLLLCLCSLLLAAGCGDGMDEGGGDGSAAGGGGETRPADGETPDDGSGGEPEAVPAELAIVVTGVAGREEPVVPAPSGMRCTRSIPATCRGEVTCPPAEDAPPLAARRCSFLARDGRQLLLEEPPAGQMCTQEFGGAAVVKVTGTFDGEAVGARFARSNGCEIARWEAAAPLWDDGALARAATAWEDEAEDGAGEVPEGGGGTAPDVVDDPPEAFS